MVLLFSLTLFVGAFLTFLMQPMVAKMVLPLFGGTTSVWTTCVLFFQVGLLAGYGYAHLGPRWLGTRRHAALHVLLLILPLAVLPIAIGAERAPPSGVNPALWLLGLLALTTGMPYVAVTATAPLLQHWFADAGHKRSRDPYFLYAASNAGSLLALLAYPVALEPNLGLLRQSQVWTGGYIGLVMLTALCGATLWRAARHPTSATVQKARSATAPVSWRTRWNWILLAAVPSSLMLSVTTYLTTDIASVPFLWVIPLALYLVTFIIAFSPRLAVVCGGARFILPVVALVLALVILSGATEPIMLLLPLHLLGAVVVGLACNGRLAALRPEPARLTEYYFLLALGGAVGGLFNALVAPILFSGIAEYPVALVLACLLQQPRAGRKPRKRSWQSDVAYGAGLGVLTLAFVLGVRNFTDAGFATGLALSFGLPAIFCYTFVDSPLRFATGLAGLFIAGLFYVGPYGERLFAERSFYGAHRVTLDPSGECVQLVHGTTVHGREALDPEQRNEPLTYYHRNSPIGRALTTLQSAEPGFRSVGVVGLGAGSLAAYARIGEDWTFYEIDPVVIALARDSGFFHFVPGARTPIRIVQGDARIELARDHAARFDLLVIDAFNSDAVPVHLLTREALAVYLERLKPGGVILFHTSNRYLDLDGVVATLAADAGLASLAAGNTSGPTSHHWQSRWVAVGRPGSRLQALADAGFWLPLPPQRDQTVWADDYSNVWSIILWRGRNSPTP